MIAPNSYDSRYVVQLYYWGTNYMVLAEGNMYRTFTGSYVGSGYLYSNYYNYDSYYCIYCNCQILIMYSTTKPSRAPSKYLTYNYRNSTSSFNDDNNGSNGSSVVGIILFFVLLFLFMCCCCAPVVYFSYKKCNKSSTVAVTTAKVVVHDSEGIPQYVHIDNPPVMYSTPAVPVYPCDGPTHQQNPNEPVPFNPYWVQPQPNSSPAGPQSNNSNNYAMVGQSNTYTVPPSGQSPYIGQSTIYYAQPVQTGGPYWQQQQQQPSYMV
mmetsp:Transcript_25099/g.34483  ORF Transcript_25099/g.34483 Transcript_25099/m.34483 type:complete len:265 (+) Transcript_25099:1078-1872(+)